MEDQKIYELAERYLEGALSEKERNDTDEKLETDPAFAQAFAKYLVASQQARALAQADWKKELMANFDQEAAAPSEDKGKIRKLNFRRFAAVAAVFLMIFTAFWLWDNSSNTDRLYADATQDIYQKRIYEQTIRSAEGEFITLFKNKDYKGALAAAETAAAQADEMDKVLWQERQGFCHWQLANWDRALVIFEELKESAVLLEDKNPGTWYQALTYLGKGDLDRCQEILEGIIEGKSDFRDRAVVLLEQLSK